MALGMLEHTLVMRVFRLRWVGFAGAALVAACSLNPQPLPPQNEDSDSGTTGAPGDASFQDDGGGAPPDAGAHDAEANDASDAGDASDASDGAIEDGAIDGPSDGGSG